MPTLMAPCRNKKCVRYKECRHAKTHEANEFCWRSRNDCPKCCKVESIPAPKVHTLKDDLRYFVNKLLLSLNRSVDSASIRPARQVAALLPQWIERAEKRNPEVMSKVEAKLSQPTIRLHRILMNAPSGVWMSPTELAEIAGHKVGSSWASPKLKRLVEAGMAERNGRGWYRCL